MKTQLQQLAKAINAAVADFEENSSFDVECGNLVAVGRVEVEIAEDKGDYYTAPYSWVEGMRVVVDALFDEWGEEIENPEYIAYLNKMMN